MNKRAYIKTKFEGVFYRESTRRDPRTGLVDRIYCFWFSDEAGKGHWRSVGRHSEGVRPQTARVARMEFLAALAGGHNPVAREVLTVGEVVDTYVAWASAEGKHVDRPLQQYTKHMRHRLHAVPVSGITPGMLTSLKGELSKTLSPQSVHHLFSFLRRAINMALATGLWTGSNPVSSKRGGWSFPRVDNGRLRFFTPVEANRLLVELQRRSVQLHDMAWLSLKTGLRATEIFKLRGEDVDSRANVLHVVGKGGMREIVHVGSDVVQVLESYGRSPADYLFQERKTGGPIKRISDTFERSVTALGLDQGGDSRFHITFHTLRHTFASWLAQSGKVSLLELKVLMRHRSLSMTQRYAHLIPGQEREKLSIIDALLHDEYRAPV